MNIISSILDKFELCYRLSYYLSYGQLIETYVVFWNLLKGKKLRVEGARKKEDFMEDNSRTWIKTSCEKFWIFSSNSFFLLPILGSTRACSNKCSNGVPSLSLCIHSNLMQKTASQLVSSRFFYDFLVLVKTVIHKTFAFTDKILTAPMLHIKFI